MHSSQNVFTLQVKTLHHPVTHCPPKPIPLAPENSYAVLPKLENHTSNRPSTILLGNSDVLARRNQRAEENLRHEINKEEWYLRNPYLPRDRRSEDEPVEEGLSGEEGSSCSNRYIDGDSEDTEGDSTSEEEDETELEEDETLSNTSGSAKPPSILLEFDNKSVTLTETSMSSSLHKPCLTSPVRLKILIIAVSYSNFNLGGTHTRQCRISTCRTLRVYLQSRSTTNEPQN